MISRESLSLQDTIFSLTTGRLPSAIAIIRISGPKAFPIAETIFQSPIEKKRQMLFGSFSTDGKKVDSGMLLTFVGPHSHSGDDTVEFHCHGSVAVVEALQSEIQKLGARPVERGEFTFRALTNGRITPKEVDTLGDVFLATESADLKRIYERADASLEQALSSVRDKLLASQAILDTAVDFSEEYSSVAARAKEPIDLVIRECSLVIQRYKTFLQGTTKPRVVLAGLPNAGKSALFNALLCRSRAIVDKTPGTTRDVIEEDIIVGGRTVKLVDTAGIRMGENEIESQGIEMGERYLGASSLWVLVVDGTKELDETALGLLDKYNAKPHLIVWNKRDIGTWNISPAFLTKHHRVFEVSATAGTGIVELSREIERLLVNTQVSVHEPIPSRVQTAQLESVVATLEKVRCGFASNWPPEVLAEEVRVATRQLSAVVGEISADDVLGRIFSEFCIGK